MPAYLKNKDLYEEVVRCLDASVYSMELHQMFEKIVTHFSYTFTYLEPMDRDDCRAQAIEDLYRYWNRFDPKYKNAFAYYTQVTKMAFAKMWRKLYPGPFTHKNKIGLDNLYSL